MGVRPEGIRTPNLLIRKVFAGLVTNGSTPGSTNRYGRHREPCPNALCTNSEGLIDLRELLLTLAIAIGTAAFQVTLKGLSRTNLTGQNHGLSRDDALFWTDWIIAAALALSGALMVASIEARPVPLKIVGGCLATLVFGCGALPLFMRTYAYDPNAELKEMGWKGIGWILIANFVGILILLSAVVTGVEIYEFG